MTVLTFAAKELQKSTIFELNSHINSDSCCCQAEVAAEAGIRCSIGCISWRATMTTKAVGKASAATGGAGGGCIKHWYVQVHSHINCSSG